MSVLRAYVGEEQAALREIDDKLASKYGLDIMKKNYTYDSTRKALIEAPTPPPAPPAAKQAAAPASPAPSKTP